ncbi:MAG: AIR synthase-related protein, partial [Chthoniobacterales bacterium]
IPTAGKPSLLDTAATLFNESQSRIVISISPNNREAVLSILREGGVPFQQLGQVGGNQLSIRVDDESFRWPMVDLHDDWWNAIRRAVESASAERIPSL